MQINYSRLYLVSLYVEPLVHTHTMQKLDLFIKITPSSNNLICETYMDGIMAHSVPNVHMAS